MFFDGKRLKCNRKLTKGFSMCVLEENDREMIKGVSMCVLDEMTKLVRMCVFVTLPKVLVFVFWMK